MSNPNQLICIHGVVEHVRFRSPQTGWTVAQLRYDQEMNQTEGIEGAVPLPGIFDAAALNGKGAGRYPSEVVTIVGELPELTAGEQLIITGRWKEHQTYGRQLQIVSFEQPLPTDREGIITYLSSNLVKGMGEAIARRVVNRFGEETLDVLEKDPDKLLEVKGIGQRVLQQIVTSWGENKEARETIMWFQAHGVRTALAVRICTHFGSSAKVVAETNPYRFTEVRGIAFTTADETAQSLGIGRDDPRRIKAGILYTLQETAARDGHTFLPREKLVLESSEILGVDVELVIQCLGEMAEDDAIAPANLLDDKSEAFVAVYHPRFYRAEHRVTENLATLLTFDAVPTCGELYESADIFRCELDAVAGKAGIELHPLQVQAIETVLKHRVSIITGGPGTGKTTCLRTLLDILDRQEATYELASPTGRAAKRLSEATGRPAMTIHRLLEAQGYGDFMRNEDDPIYADVVIIDEASMIDLPLADSLIRAITPGTHLLFVGDVDQLPSVGVGNVLRDMIDSEVIPTVRLQVVFRQAENSGIISNAHRINSGEMPLSGTDVTRDDFFVIRQDDPAAAARMIVKIVQRLATRYGIDPLQDIQVLAPMKRGEIGVNNLNMLLQNALNPLRRWDQQHVFGRYLAKGAPVLLQNAPERMENIFGFIRDIQGNEVVAHFGSDEVRCPRQKVLETFTVANAFRVGDKVLQRVNAYDLGVFNGDWGFIQAIDRDAKKLVVDFEDQIVEYDFDHVLDNLIHAYALTIHKSQGSEYPCVVAPVMTQHFIMLRRNLLYTALTRAKDKAVFVGQGRAVAMAVKNNDVAHRFSYLDKRLQVAASYFETQPVTT